MIDIGDLSALVQVIIVDLVLAGDNAIVIAIVVARFAPKERARLLMLGVIAATVVRILFALVATELLKIVGLMLAGGLLLLWVCWKLWRELEGQRGARRTDAAKVADDNSSEALIPHQGNVPQERDVQHERKSMRDAITQIVIADVSMSLDNVIAVAGIARDKTWVLVVGLVLSIAFMAFAATLIARLLTRHHWIAYVGLIIIVYVAGSLIWDGAASVLQARSVTATISP